MDPLQTLTNLEEQYYAEGYALGHHDGAQAGRREGRQFGMEKGFEKFSDLGRLSGWAAVIAAQRKESSSSERLQRHLAKITELTDINNISTENSEEGVADTDERLREVKSKEMLIMKMLGTARSQPSKNTSSELEDFGGLGRRAPQSDRPSQSQGS